MMKKTMLLVLSTIAFIYVHAQTEKGRFAIAGNTDLSFLAVNSKTITDSITSQEVKTRRFEVNPSLAYFVADNFAVGVSGTFTYNRTIANTPLGYLHNWAAGVIPSLTYFFPVSSSFKPTLSAGVGYLWLFDEGVDANGLTYNGKAGVSYFVNKNVSLDLGVQYTVNRLNDNQDDRRKYHQNAVGALFGASIYF